MSWPWPPSSLGYNEARERGGGGGGGGGGQSALGYYLLCGEQDTRSGSPDAARAHARPNHVLVLPIVTVPVDASGH